MRNCGVDEFDYFGSNTLETCRNPLPDRMSFQSRNMPLCRHERRLNKEILDANHYWVSARPSDTKHSVQQVDYCVSDYNRFLKVCIDNRIFYNNSDSARDVSSQIVSFLLRKLVTGNEGPTNLKGKDMCYDEMLETVRAVFPTELELFTAVTFSSLVRMSSVFQVQKLKQACELYVARLPLNLDELNSELVAFMLNDSFKYTMSSKSKVRLLQGVIGLIDAEIQDPTKTLSYNRHNSCILPIIASLIDAALLKFRQGHLGHDVMLNEARLKIPCRNCRCEKASNGTSAITLKVCRRCRQTTCLQCFARPCASLVEQFMENFINNYSSS